MGKPQRRFTKEFEAEAVRLVETSGRAQREIAEDLGASASKPAQAPSPSHRQPGSIPSYAIDVVRHWRIF